MKDRYTFRNGDGESMELVVAGGLVRQIVTCDGDVVADTVVHGSADCSEWLRVALIDYGADGWIEV